MPLTRRKKEHRDLTSSATVAGAGSGLAASVFALAPERVVDRGWVWKQPLQQPPRLEIHRSTPTSQASLAKGRCQAQPDGGILSRFYSQSSICTHIVAHSLFACETGETAGFQRASGPLAGCRGDGGKRVPGGDGGKCVPSGHLREAQNDPQSSTEARAGHG